MRWIAALTAALMLVASAAFADYFEAVPDEVPLDMIGATEDVAITLIAMDDGTGQGCNLGEGQPSNLFVTASVTSSDPSVATVTPDELTFYDCGEAQTITITAVGCGEATITIEAIDWRAEGGPNAVFSDATIEVVVDDETCNGNGYPKLCARPAAPAWANAILDANGIKGPKRGQYISAVAQAMEQGASFGGYAKHEDGYADAVWQFLQDEFGLDLPIGPDEAARPGWVCKPMHD
jgi:hypothetical protein